MLWAGPAAEAEAARAFTITAAPKASEAPTREELRDDGGGASLCGAGFRFRFWGLGLRALEFGVYGLGPKSRVFGLILQRRLILVPYEPMYTYGHPP